MLNTKFKLLGSILSLMAVGTFTPSSQASTITTTLSNVTIIGTSSALLSMNGVPGGRPACHNGASYPTAYAFDVSTAKGQAILSLAQAALIAGKSVLVSGGSTCTNVNGINVETATQVTVWST